MVTGIAASIQPMQDYLSVQEEVADGLAGGRAVVALESTVIAHGLPYPDNEETALAMEQAVRDSGAIPATIAVIGGKIRIGLSEDERAQLADPSGDVAKLSRRDIAVVLTSGGVGATTVSATMICAHAAGIRCFATGGIGGVHRGADESMDISADLLELARTPVLTVASGAKGILDLPKTREVLETQGVPILGYQTDRMPAFHCRDSGLSADCRVNAPKEAAQIAAAHWALGLGGLLVCNPVPDHAAIASEEMEAWIAAATSQANAEGVVGGAVTPFILSRIADLSKGRSLTANKALLVDNAKLGGEISVAMKREQAS